MFERDSRAEWSGVPGFGAESAGIETGQLSVFYALKRVFDVSVSVLLLLPLMVIVAGVLLVLNPFFNPGKLFFIQSRMGLHCKPFRAIKFRTMRESGHGQRSAHDPLEVDRITRLGGFLRKARLDELPQILNVLKGEMSLIGPRPDYYEHARHFLNEVDGYRERHSVRPGISGLAQTELGYIEGVEATRGKVDLDMYYIRNANIGLEARILWQTIAVVLRRRGS